MKIETLFLQLQEKILSLAAHALPDWALIIVSLALPVITIAVIAPVIMMYLTLFERKVVGRMQNRIGPNRVGIFGLLQPIADGIKMLTKEDIVPVSGDHLLHFLAPILAVIPAILVFAVLPFGKNMTAVDLNVGLLYFIAISSTATIAIFMASWSSRNKYSLLGGMRSVAQMVSYEVPMVLSVVPVILLAGTLSTHGIVEAQGAWHGLKWFIFTPWGALAFIIFFLCGTAEVNRSPFDLPEAESEIVAGFHTEYSGMKFALFYMAEFLNTFTVCGLGATLFLGGWQGPFLPSWIWFFIKTLALIFIMVWFRGTLPRFRVDQLMAFAWRFLLPLALINLFIAGLWYYLPTFILRVWVCGFLTAGSVMLFSKWNAGLRPDRRAYILAD